MTKPAPSLGVVAPNISPAVTHVVDRALAFDRDSRWRDAQRMQDAVRDAYHERYQAPIGTAPRLTVPPNVPNRTLPTAAGAMAARLPTTGQPVMGGSRAGSAAASIARSPKLVASVVIGGAIALAIAIVGVAWVIASARHTEPEAASSTAAAPTAPATAAATAPFASIAPPTPSAPALPVVVATDLPPASAPTAAPQPAATATASPPGRVAPPVAPPLTAAPTAPSKTNCNPNYVMIKGIKHFKPECM
jgi:hypothetical protein